MLAEVCRLGRNVVFGKRLSCMACLGALFLFSCASGSGGPSLAPLTAVEGRANETLIVHLVVTNAVEGLSFDVVSPSNLTSTRPEVSGGGGGGTFRWNVRANHIGKHEFTILLKKGGTVVDRELLVVTIVSSEDFAPTFVRPGQGGAFDPQKECVSFDVEIRDDDSDVVEIKAREELPAGASLMPTGKKSASFDWCPTEDQIASSSRWTISLQAKDDNHDPVNHDYVVVFRSEPRPDCPGSAPVVSIIAPEDEERLEASPDYRVEVSVTDDLEVRDAPVLYYTTEVPENLEEPDVGMFDEFLSMEKEAEMWVGRIPPLELAEGEEQTVYFVVSATDNDDPTGTACDHRTDSPLRTFTAVGGSTTATLADCEPCSGSGQCESGLCSTNDRRCVARCIAGGCLAGGECQGFITTEGNVIDGCGSVAEVCDGPIECEDDNSREDNDTVSTATSYSGPISDGQICAEDPDFYRVPISPGTRVTATLEGFDHNQGDLDLFLMDAAGTTLVTQAGVGNREVAEYCYSTGDEAIIRVEGYSDSENPYTLRVDTESAGVCCSDDSHEGNDDQSNATLITFSGDSTNYSGTICPGNRDWFSFFVRHRSEIRVTLSMDEGDLDLNLHRPDGSRLATSAKAIGTEQIDAIATEPGTYAIQVYSLRNHTSDYQGMIQITELDTCSNSRECPISQVCDGTECVDRVCDHTRPCPADHRCPDAGPSPFPSECGQTCSIARDCRPSESCKWFPEGRSCERSGDGRIGDACTTFSDCAGRYACVPWPGGTCAPIGCTSNAECTAESNCVDSGRGYNICAKTCASDSNLCRLGDGYECVLTAPVGGGNARYTCVPGS